MKFIRGFFSTIFAIILVAFLSGFITLLSVKNVIDKENLTEVIKNIDFNDLIKDKNGDYTDLGHDIRNELIDGGVPKELVDDFVEADAITDFVADYLTQSVDYIFYGEEMDELSASDIADLINDNIDDIFDEMIEDEVDGYEELTPERIAYIKSKVDEIAEQMDDSIPNIKNIFGDSEYVNALDIIRFVFSDLIIYAFIAVTAILSLFIVLLNLRRCRFGYWLGTIYITSAIPFMVAGVVGNTATIGTNSKAVNYICKYLATRILVVSSIFLGIGLLFLVLAIIVGGVSRRKDKKAVKEIETESTPEVIEEVEEEKEEVVSDKKFCASCGATLEDNQQFCFNCGAKVGDADASVEEKVDEPTEEKVDEPTEEKVDEPTEEPTEEKVEEEKKEEPVEETKEEEATFCANCGTKIDASEKFCPNCGSKK